MEEGPQTVTKSGEVVEVMDGSDIMELVENDKVFSNFVDHKFRDLDRDCDGHLSVKELQPAVADIGAALGLPPQGTSADSDHIYAEVLSEFTHGLKRDPIVILRIDGEDLLEFIESPSFEPEMMSIFSEIDIPNGSLTDYINKAFEKLTVDKGMPPVLDSWVTSNIITPALQSCGVAQEQPVSQDAFLLEFKKVLETVAQRLKDQPVIVAHSENTFDGTGVRRLLSNKFELEKTLDTTVKTMPKDQNGKISKNCVRLALDFLASVAGLPPLGAVYQIDEVIAESCKMLDMDDGKLVKEEEFKKILTELLGSIMLQLEGNPIAVSTNSVVHEPLASASTLLQPLSM
ncbi:unnamed protein product [Lactuca saligna]|uniref:EF-hand domain-containing protein n=1 Tax=Lactuca saligna TaxID=75948 RepID=A0AA35ZUX8_LACSI|nr:unnamed protein product [Lactuca saligna]